MVIYKTTNLINDKFYVGKDVKNNPEYLGSGNLIVKAIKKYGKENFNKEILEVCKDRKDLAEKERYWINKLDARNKTIGYNISEGGDGGDTFSGHPDLDRIKKKISDAAIGREVWNKGKTNVFSEKALEKMRKSKIGFIPWHKGKKDVYTKKTLKKFSLAKKNKNLSKEHKNNISKSLIGHIGYMSGKKHKKATKDNIAKSLEKEVLMVINNKVLKKWKSPEKANKELGLTIKSIRYFCRKKDVKNKYGLIYKIDYEKTI